MSGKRRYKAARDKRESGGFTPLPYVVLRSAGFARLGPHAVKLLMDFLAQYKGDNNGDLCAAWTLMKERGWRSRDTLNKARRTLLDGDWIVTTRQGGRHRPTLYAVTFYAIDECGGKLDVRSSHSPPSTWRRHEPLPVLRGAFKNNSLTRGAGQNGAY